MRSTWDYTGTGHPTFSTGSVTCTGTHDSKCECAHTFQQAEAQHTEINQHMCTEAY